MKVSSYIICLNEEEYIEQALKSLRFTDEIVVVDSGSSDRTLEIAKRYTDKIYFNEWKGFSEQRNFALDRCGHDWVLPLDADETVLDECAKKIIQIMKEGTNRTWFKIKRKEHFNGVYQKYGIENPSYQIRLFRKSKGRYEGKVHEYPKMDENKMGLIHEPINHYSVKSFAEVKNNAYRYAKLSAEQKQKEGVRHDFFYKYFSGLAQFLKAYITHLGFMDGLYGFYRACGNYLEFYYRQKFLWELWNKK